MVLMWFLRSGIWGLLIVNGFRRRINDFSVWQMAGLVNH